MEFPRGRLGSSPFLRKGEKDLLPFEPQEYKAKKTGEEPGLGTARSVPSIFFGPPKSSRVLAWQRVLGESSFPQASLESKEDWPGGPLKDRSGAQALVPFLKRVHSSPFPSFPCLQAGRRGGALLPGKKGKGVGPAQAGKGWPPGRLQGGEPPRKALDPSKLPLPKEGP